MRLRTAVGQETKFSPQVLPAEDCPPTATFADMKLRDCLPSVLLVFIGCVEALPEERNTTTPATVGDTAIAAPAVPVLPARYVEQWTLPPLRRWETYWLEQYPADSTGDLSQRHVDLDGDGRADHALFLTRKDTARHDSTYALVIVLATGRDTLLAAYDWAEYQGGIGLGLTCEPPGELTHLGGEGDEEDTPSSTPLTTWAITMQFFEKAAITWYWQDGRFHQVWTGD